MRAWACLLLVACAATPPPVEVEAVRSSEFFVGEGAGRLTLHGGLLTFDLRDARGPFQFDPRHLGLELTAFTQRDAARVLAGARDRLTGEVVLLELTHRLSRGPDPGVVEIRSITRDSGLGHITAIAHEPGRTYLLDASVGALWSVDLKSGSLSRLTGRGPVARLQETRHLHLRELEGGGFTVRASTTCALGYGTPLIGAQDRVEVTLYDLDGDGTFDITH